MIENRQISAPVVSGLLRVADLVMVALTGLLAFYARFGNLDLQSQDLMVLVLVTLLAANVFQFFRLYEFQQMISDPMEARRLLMAVVTVAFVALFLGYVTKMTASFSRIWIGLWGVFAVTALFGVRSYFRFRLRGCNPRVG